jgi:transcriptional regulator with XRE-family HTH domain
MIISASFDSFVAMYYIVSIMIFDAKKGVRPLRPKALPAELRSALIEARQKRAWSQRDLASHLGIGQRHISGIESGKIVPRYDTLLEIVRMLDRDLIMVPRTLVPVVQSLVRDHHKDQEGEGEERSLYAADRDYDSSQEPRDEV